MTNCKQCDKVLTHIEGRKKKMFCDNNCKNKYFYKKNKDLVKAAKEITEVKVADLNVQSTGTVQDLTKEPPKTNYAVNIIPKNPITLDELKAMCPPHLTGFERSQWISTERVKYGI